MVLSNSHSMELMPFMDMLLYHLSQPGQVLEFIHTDLLNQVELPITLFFLFLTLQPSLHTPGIQLIKLTKQSIQIHYMILQLQDLKFNSLLTDNISVYCLTMFTMFIELKQVIYIPMYNLPKTMLHIQLCYSAINSSLLTPKIMDILYSVQNNQESNSILLLQPIYNNIPLSLQEIFQVLKLLFNVICSIFKFSLLIPLQQYIMLVRALKVLQSTAQIQSFQMISSLEVISITI